MQCLFHITMLDIKRIKTTCKLSTITINSYICSPSYMWRICSPSCMWGISFSHMWKTLAWLHYFDKRGGLVPRNSLTMHIVIEVPVPTQESVRSSIYVFGVTTLPLSMIVLLDFATVPIVLHFLLLFLFYFITDLLPSITHF
jgi:hypothetical protein